MKFDPKNESDFLKHPLFLKWIGSPNAELDRFWKDWSDMHPDKAEMMWRAKELTKPLTWKHKYAMDQKDYNKVLDNLIIFNAKYDQEQKITKIGQSRRPDLFKWFVPIAASVLLLGFLLLNYLDLRNYTDNGQTEEARWEVRTAPKGVKKAFHLPDGSKVILNSDSEIRYLSSFENERTVELIGQAFFEVKKNPDLPFQVKSGALNTTVLGTSFDVKAYPDDPDFHVAVVTGKVKVATENGVSAHITPHEATYYDAKANSLTKGNYDFDLLIGWKERTLKFHEESYEQVFNRLSRWYNVEFEIEKEVSFHGKYSGEFKDETLNNVLHGMQYSLGFQYRIEGEKVIIMK